MQTLPLCAFDRQRASNSIRITAIIRRETNHHQQVDGKEDQERRQDSQRVKGVLHPKARLMPGAGVDDDGDDGVGE